MSTEYKVLENSGDEFKESCVFEALQFNNSMEIPVIEEIEDLEDFLLNPQCINLSEITFWEVFEYWTSQWPRLALHGIQLFTKLNISEHPWFGDPRVVFALFEAESLIPPEDHFRVHFLLCNILIHHPEKPSLMEVLLPRIETLSASNLVDLNFLYTLIYYAPEIHLFNPIVPELVTSIANNDLAVRIRVLDCLKLLLFDQANLETAVRSEIFEFIEKSLIPFTNPECFGASIALLLLLHDTCGLPRYLPEIFGCFHMIIPSMNDASLRFIFDFVDLVPLSSLFEFGVFETFVNVCNSACFNVKQSIVKFLLRKSSALVDSAINQDTLLSIFEKIMDSFSELSEQEMAEFLSSVYKFPEREEIWKLGHRMLFFEELIQLTGADDLPGISCLAQEFLESVYWPLEIAQEEEE